MTWANRITIGRFLLIPVFVGLLVYYNASTTVEDMVGWRYAALAVFLIAAISDGVDGYLARHWNQRTALGAVLDPIADKLLMLAALVTLSIIRIGGHPPFPLWFPIIIIGRDAILLVGFLVLTFLAAKVDVRPHWSGKFSTFCTFIAIGSALLGSGVTLWACEIGGMAALISTIVYVRAGIRILNQTTHGKPLNATQPSNKS
jgi:cardiolipin synthase (CMP-forming)